MENSITTSKVVANHSAANDDNTLGQYIPLLYHYNMLQDTDRVGSFQRAIELMVKPGMHVVELGGGTGVLSSFAAKRGAEVTCVERNPELVKTAKRLLNRNGLAEQVKVVQADASCFTPDRPVDVVVCEMLHVGLLREKQANVIAAFKRNYTSAYATGSMPVFIPEATILMVQLIEQSFDFAGYDAPVPMFQSPMSVQPRTIEISSLSPYSNFAYSHSIPLHLKHHESIAAEQPGHFNAIRLATQNVLAIDEQQQEAITWANQHLVLPIEEPKDVNTGDQIEVDFEYRSGDSIEKLQDALRLTIQTTAK